MNRTGAKRIIVLGVFVADTTFRTHALPRIGETLLGRSFALGPGGKGSNQAVAAARLGGDVHFVTRLGEDTFADMARSIWRDAGVHPSVESVASSYTGAACVLVDDASGDNAIVIAPGAGGELCAADLNARAALFDGAGVFVTQCEQPLEAAMRGLELARAAGVTTVFNPAPATELPEEMLPLCDYVTPNETEASELTGVAVAGLDDARCAAEVLLARGVGAVVITLGEQGACLHDGRHVTHVPAMRAGRTAETTGAGDAFNGAFAVALAEGRDALDATRFGCAAAAISVTRPGTAQSMPRRSEVQALLEA